MKRIGNETDKIPSHLSPIPHGEKNFARWKVKKEVYKLLAATQQKNGNGADKLPTSLTQQRIEKKELIKAMKIKAKDYYEKKDFGKAYALYHHVRTLDPNDTLTKIRINEIKGMQILLTKSDAIIALSGFFIKE